jgi:6-phosphofructokinase 2
LKVAANNVRLLKNAVLPELSLAARGLPSALSGGWSIRTRRSVAGQDPADPIALVSDLRKRDEHGLSAHQLNREPEGTIAMSRILCVSLNPTIDITSMAQLVEPTHKIRTRGQLHQPGGGGVNVARVIAELGGAPALAYLSGGATGPLLDDLLAGRGISLHRFAMRGPVRIALMVRETSTGREFRFVPEGPEVSAPELAPLLAHLETAQADYLVLSGSLPRGVGSDCYAGIAAEAARRGIRIVLDTSGEALRKCLDTGGIHLFKPSKRELELIVGRRLDAEGVREEAVKLVHSRKAEIVAVSLGSEGAILAHAGGTLVEPAIAVKTVSAVGAGDSFCGAMVWALSQGKEVEQAFRLGLAAGAAAVMNPQMTLARKDDTMAIVADAGWAIGT